MLDTIIACYEAHTDFFVALTLLATILTILTALQKWGGLLWGWIKRHLSFRPQEDSDAQLKRKLALKERMKKDFIKPNYMKEVYGDNHSAVSKRPWGKFVSDRVMIRDIEDRTYPDAPIRKKGISPFFWLTPVDFYHNGFCFWATPQSVVIDECDNWVMNAKKTPKGFVRMEVQTVCYVPYSYIVNYDVETDEYGYGPMLYCDFIGPKGEPYEKVEHRPITADGPPYLWVLDEGRRYTNSFIGWQRLRLRRLMDRLKRNKKDEF